MASDVSLMPVSLGVLGRGSRWSTTVRQTAFTVRKEPFAELGTHAVFAQTNAVSRSRYARGSRGAGAAASYVYLMPASLSVLARESTWLTTARQTTFTVGKKPCAELAARAVFSLV